MKRIAANLGKRRRAAAASATAKPYWEMNAEELSHATAEFDREFIGETFGEPDRRQQSRHTQAKVKRGRPKIGQGVRVISVSLEKNLLAAVDRLAKKKKAKRAELITVGLQAVLNGDIQLAKR
jgi:hypothetical protein